jgi:hypothetical protein
MTLSEEAKQAQSSRLPRSNKMGYNIGFLAVILASVRRFEDGLVVIDRFELGEKASAETYSYGV